MDDKEGFKKLYKLRIVIDKDGEVEEIMESLDYDVVSLFIRGVNVSKYLDDETNVLLQDCSEVGES